MELIIVVIQSVTALQSLEVAASAWWVVRLPHKLKGHRLYPQNSLHVHRCRRGRLRRSSHREGDTSCMYIHLRGICKEKKNTPHSSTCLFCLCWFTIGKKAFHVPKQKRHQSYKQHISISQLITDYCGCSILLLPSCSISEPHCEAAGYNSSSYIVQCQLAEKNRLQLAWNWKYIVDQLPLWWWQYTSVAIGWSCCWCNWCCSVAASAVGGM